MEMQSSVSPTYYLAPARSCLNLVSAMTKSMFRNCPIKLQLLTVIITAVCIVVWMSTDRFTFMKMRTVHKEGSRAVENKDNIPVVLPHIGNKRPNEDRDRPNETGKKMNSSEGAARERLKEELSKDMQRCSLAMGMSQDTVNQRLDKINQIAEKAAFFLNTFWEIVPKPQDFLPDYKNPCWYSKMSISKNVANYFFKSLPAYSNRNISDNDLEWFYEELYEKQSPQPTLQCLPYFLFPGFLKSGTTTLHSALKHHPRIAQPEKKEPQWWYKVPLDKGKKYLEVFIARYLTNFLDPANEIGSSVYGPESVTYDASQTLTVNVYDSSFHIDHEDYCGLPAVISKVLPNAKIILLMRDPVQRAYSHYLQMHNGGYSTAFPSEMRANPAQFFHDRIIKALPKWDSCVKEQSLYECTNSVRTLYNELAVRLGSGIYHIHILKWMQFWPRENFLLLKMEDMSVDPAATMRKITDFLDLKRIPEDQAADWINHRKNQRKVKTSMLDKDIELLEAFYEPFNKKMDELFGITWTYKN